MRPLSGLTLQRWRFVLERVIGNKAGKEERLLSNRSVVQLADHLCWQQVGEKERIHMFLFSYSGSLFSLIPLLCLGVIAGFTGVLLSL